MIEAEPSSLALFWASVIAVAIMIYVILDGFDLGIGACCSALPKTRSVATGW